MNIFPTNLDSAQWQGISGWLALASLLVAVILGILQALGVFPIAATPANAILEIRRLVTASEIGYLDPSSSPDVKITLKGKEVAASSIAVHTLEITNSGQKAIEPGDWVSPLSMTVDSGLQIIGVSPLVSPASSSSLQWTISNSVTASTPPMLLNPKDSYLISVLTYNPSEVRRTQTASDLRWTARIKGVKVNTINDATLSTAKPIINVPSPSWLEDVSVHLLGYKLIWTVLAFFVLLYLNLSLWPSAIGPTTSAGRVLVMALGFLSFSSAEILVDLSYAGTKQPWIAWLLLVGHALLVTLLMRRNKAASAR